MNTIVKLLKVADKIERKLNKLADKYDWNKPHHIETIPMEQAELHLKKKPHHIETQPMLPAEEMFEEEKSSSEDLPDDYETCSVCGYDHEYDIPLLPRNSPKYKEAKRLHEEFNKEDKEAGNYPYND